MREVRINSIVRTFLCILSIIILSACVPKDKVSYVSEQEAAELRKQYPYNDSESSMASSASADRMYPTFDAVVEQYDYHSIIAIKFVGEWYTISNSMPIYNEEELNNIVEQKTPSINDLTFQVHDAVVVDVLWSGSDLSPGDVITIGFGADIITNGMNLQATYSDQKSFVCCVFDMRSMFEEYDIPFFTTHKNASWHLTNKDVILSVTSAPGPDSVSGMYLDAFATLVNETLGPPDAELTPVEPELQTE